MSGPVTFTFLPTQAFLAVDKEFANNFYLSIFSKEYILHNHFFLLNIDFKGAYGDNINELSWAVGTIIKELEELEIAEDTLVVFMSDHGPHLEYCLDAGDPGIFRGESIKTDQSISLYQRHNITPRSLFVRNEFIEKL